MSRMSLISGAQSSAAEFHLLIDKVLLETGEAPSADALKLAGILEAAACSGSEQSTLEGLMLDSFLRDDTGRCSIDYQRLANAVRQGMLDEPSRADLAMMADRLNKERSQLASRIAGW